MAVLLNNPHCQIVITLEWPPGFACNAAHAVPSPASAAAGKQRQSRTLTDAIKVAHTIRHAGLLQPGIYVFEH